MPSEHADDPARWLVVFNSADADSAAWADAYAAARGVSGDNMLGLPLSPSEQISVGDYLALRAELLSHIGATGLGSRLMGVLLGYHVPGRVDVFGDGNPRPMGSLLFDLLGPGPPAVLATDGPPTRPTIVTLNGTLMASRIDAPDLAGALALIDRATAISGNELTDADGAIFLDPYTTPGVSTTPIIDAMVSWAGSLDRMRTRLPLRMSATSNPGAEVQFGSIDGDAFFWGWSAATPPSGFFGSPVGRRVFCFQLHSVTPTAASLRSASSGWAGPALAAGYAAAAGSTAGFSLDAMPFARPFFEALRRGWTLAEAWWVACPVPGQELYLIGDPLMTVNMPRAGWDVFGPLDRLEDLDPHTPTLALREAERSAPVEPGEGVSRYLVRRLDALGRTEAGITGAVAVSAAGVAVEPPLPPAWPAHADWPVAVEDGACRLLAVWERSVATARTTEIVLEAEIDGGAVQPLQTLAPPLTRWIETTVELPGVSARFRWCVRSADGVELRTPWSAVVRPASFAGDLSILET